jgi:hypothetical protein
VISLYKENLGINLSDPCHPVLLPPCFCLPLLLRPNPWTLNRPLKSLARRRVPQLPAAVALKKVALRAATAAARDTQCDWIASTITKRDEKKMRSLGLISDEEGDVRLPGSDSRPNPPAGFTVMFSAFLYRGMSLSTQISSGPPFFIRYSALAADAEIYSPPCNFYHFLRSFSWYRSSLWPMEEDLLHQAPQWRQRTLHHRMGRLRCSEESQLF